MKKDKIKKVLKLKEMEEKELLNKFNDLYLSLIEEKNQLEIIKQKEKEIINKFFEIENGNINVNKINEKNYFLDSLEKLKEIKLRKIKMLEEEIEKIKQELIEKSKKKKVIEKLIDKINYLEEYESSKNEQKKFDNISIFQLSFKNVEGV